jgi:predicted dinucleotide-binding enzyme
MNIAIIGAGNVGRALGMRWAEAGHAVTFGTRDPDAEKARELAALAGVAVATPGVAAAAAEIIVLATPWPVTYTVVEGLGDLTGKILVDATNPIAPGLQLDVGQTTSGAEEIAKRAPGARVVKAFNTTGYNNMLDPVYGGESTTLFIAGDDGAAKATVAELAETLGFDVADVGGLSTARFLEPLALAWISLAMSQGREIAFKLVRR